MTSHVVKCKKVAIVETRSGQSSMSAPGPGGCGRCRSARVAGAAGLQLQVPPCLAAESGRRRVSLAAGPTQGPAGPWIMAIFARGVPVMCQAARGSLKRCFKTVWPVAGLGGCGRCRSARVAEGCRVPAKTKSRLHVHKLTGSACVSANERGRALDHGNR